MFCMSVVTIQHAIVQHLQYLIYLVSGNIGKCYSDYYYYSHTDFISIFYFLLNVQNGVKLKEAWQLHKGGLCSVCISVFLYMGVHEFLVHVYVRVYNVVQKY